MRRVPASPGERDAAGAGRAIGRLGAGGGAVRRIGGQRQLPSGRALLGALLVVGAAITTYAAAQRGDEQPTVRYVVAARDLSPGEVLDGGDLRVVALDLPDPVAGSAYAVPLGAAVQDVVAELSGAVTRGPVAAGSLITDVDVEPAAGGGADRYREISFAVPSARALLGDLAPGDRVDVVAATGDTTTVVVQRALVLGAAGGDSDLFVSDDVVITLALDRAEEVLAVAHGAATSDLTVIRSTRASEELPTRYPATPTTSGSAS